VKLSIHALVIQITK